MTTLKLTVLVLLCCVLTGPLSADGPSDNVPDQVRPVPPVGIELSATDRTELTTNLAQLDDTIAKLRSRADDRTSDLLPDVEIFARAVRQAVEYRELFAPDDVPSAKRLLQAGLQRANALLDGDAPWTTQKGLVVRGYRSVIDHTVQPYGLVIPDSYSNEGKDRYRLDLWFHGRDERLSESAFIAQRMAQPGRFTPPDTIVLHPYGRYCNAFKFAGEVDVLEALAHAKQHYRVDDDRVAVRGFSMGGAGCWQMAVHYPDLFFAANPGAGFAETPEFLRTFQQETLQPTSYERRLWTMYDCPGYAINLFQLPTVAYSGELDVQKQAADMMQQAMAAQGLRLTHIIGPGTKHAIHPDSARIIEAKLEQLAELGRPRLPLELRFATYTLKYNRLHWLTVTQLGTHWQQATVSGRIRPDENRVDLQVNNVTALRLSMPAGRSPFAPDRPVEIRVTQSQPNQPTVSAGELPTVVAPRPASDKSWECDLRLDGDHWQLGQVNDTDIRKQHNLQGPIDDAFLDSFIIVRPTGQARHEALASWSNAELDRLVREWRRQFRGDARVKRDDEITPDDIATSHLILFGDPASNAVLASIVESLPIRWTADEIVVGDRSYDAACHAPLLIFPNPANPQRYVVLNSGFTYREYAYLNNARQVPKLPDWAIVDLRTPTNSLWPGRIVDADFFDEAWKVK